jgi:signal transduction histidine kinase
MSSLFGPRRKFRFIFLIYANGILVIMLYMVLSLRTLGKAMESIVEKYGVDPQVAHALNFTIRATSLTVGASSLALAVFIGMTSFAMSRRIFGPIVSIKRQIEELRKKNYSSRGKLRKDDEFQDVMEELNELASQLES